jgi:hypothetical protein
MQHDPTGSLQYVGLSRTGDWIKRDFDVRQNFDRLIPSGFVLTRISRLIMPASLSSHLCADWSQHATGTATQTCNF